MITMFSLPNRISFINIFHSTDYFHSESSSFNNLTFNFRQLASESCAVQIERAKKKNQCHTMEKFFSAFRWRQSYKNRSDYELIDKNAEETRGTHTTQFVQL